MDKAVLAITWGGIAWAFVPALAVVVILWRWTRQGGTGLYSLARMLAQLLIVGYLLVFLFDVNHAGIVLGVLLVMMAAASWIAIRPLARRNPRRYLHALVAVAVGGLSALLLTTQVVIRVEPWYLPRYVLPLAGMMLSGSMNAVSLAAERLEAEHGRGTGFHAARSAALNAAMIPVVNSLLAVGVVSLPGMMTGQILSGVSPVIAAQYQIVIMCMLFASSGLSAAAYLWMAGRDGRAG